MTNACIEIVEDEDTESEAEAEKEDRGTSIVNEDLKPKKGTITIKEPHKEPKTKPRIITAGEHKSTKAVFDEEEIITFNNHVILNGEEDEEQRASQRPKSVVKKDAEQGKERKESVDSGRNEEIGEEEIKQEDEKEQIHEDNDEKQGEGREEIDTDNEPDEAGANVGEDIKGKEAIEQVTTTAIESHSANHEKKLEKEENEERKRTEGKEDNEEEKRDDKEEMDNDNEPVCHVLTVSKKETEEVKCTELTEALEEGNGIDAESERRNHDSTSDEEESDEENEDGMEESDAENEHVHDNITDDEDSLETKGKEENEDTHKEMVGTKENEAVEKGKGHGFQEGYVENEAAVHDNTVLETEEVIEEKTVKVLEENAEEKDFDGDTKGQEDEKDQDDDDDDDNDDDDDETRESVRKKARLNDSTDNTGSDSDANPLVLFVAAAKTKANVLGTNSESNGGINTPTNGRNINYEEEQACAEQNDSDDDEDHNDDDMDEDNDGDHEGKQVDEHNDVEGTDNADDSIKCVERKGNLPQVDIVPRPCKKLISIDPPLKPFANNRVYAPMGSDVVDKTPSSAVVRPPSGRRLTFPEKLMELLNSEETQNAMCWIQVGNAFALHQSLFMKNILPVHFEGTKFESFTRKLNRWGFKRIAGEGIPENAFAYSHHLFKLDYPELCRGMSGGKKVEQDFSHLIRVREMARRFPDGQQNLLAAVAPGNIGGGGGAMGGSMGGGMGGSMGPGMNSGLGSGIGGGMATGMGGVMGGGMGGLGGRYPGMHGGDTLQSLEVENLLLERQIGMGGGGGLGGAEREFAIREAMLRQEAAVREQRLDQQLRMERMIREQHGGGGGVQSGIMDGENRRAAFLARDHPPQSLHSGGGFGRDSGIDMDRQQLHMFAERHAMQERQALQDRMTFFSGPGQVPYMGNGSGGMYPPQGSDRSEMMLREEEEAAARMRLERRLIHDAAMREHQGFASMSGSGGRYGGGM